jgi:putative hemolysin
MLPELLILFFLILLNGFFSLSEMAVISSRKARLRHEAEQGKKNYRIALETAENPSEFLSTIQVVITLIGTLAGAFGGATVARELETTLRGMEFFAKAAGPLSIGIVVVGTTFFSVVVGELVPKNLALAHPESIAAWVIRPLKIFTLLFKPIVTLLSGATEFIVRLTGTRGLDDPAVTEEEVKVLIAQGTETGVFNTSEREMVEGVLGLGDRRVTSLMTPRTDVVCVDKSDAPEEIRKTVVENAGFAYIPVIDGDLDRLIGMVSTSELLAAFAGRSFTVLSDYVRKPVLVPESISALKAVSALKDGEVKTALIADEYGGIAGLVAFSDLIESILGEVPLSGGEAGPDMVRREDGSWLVDGSMSIERFVKELDLDKGLMGNGDYETLAGLVLDKMGSIPKAGERCSWESCSIEVVDMDGNRIDKVIVSISGARLDENAAPGGAEPEEGGTDFD